LSLWDYFRVVRPESQGGQIPELTALIQWTSGEPGSTLELQQEAWEHLQHAREHLGVLTTSRGPPATSLGIPSITVSQSRKNTIFYANATGAPGNYSYFILFTDF